MPVNLNVQVNTSAVRAMLKDLQKDLPYALSTGINNTLVLAQTDEMNKIRDTFTIRREGFLKKSLKIQFAKKTNLTGTLSVADVGGKSTADIFSKFESGGNKTAQGMIAIPTEDVRKDVTKVITSAKRPRNIKNAFKTVIGGVTVIARQASKKVIKVSYILKNSVRIRPMLGFETTVTSTVNKNLYNEMEKVCNRIIEKANQ